MISRHLIRFSQDVLQCNVRRITAFKGNKHPFERTSKTTKDILTTVLEGRTINSANDWLEVRKEILNEKTHITSQNIDAMMLGFYTNSRNYEMAKKYVEFLKNRKEKMNLATTGRCFRLFYLLNEGKDLTEEEDTELLKMYEDIRRVYPVLDPITLDNIIEGLSVTSKWEICLDLLKEVKFTATPSNSTYNAIVTALFKHDKEDLGWDLLHEMLEEERVPKTQTLLSYLDYVSRNRNTRKTLSERIEKLFLFLQENNIKPDLEFARDLLTFLKKSDFTASIVKINRGKCKSCEASLKKFELSTQEFETLKSSIIKKVIIGRDVFNKTTPDELKKFNDFIAENKTYDVIIDGLNVAYSSGTKQNPKVHSTLVSAVIQFFKDQDKKVLLLGRQHMNKWPKFGYIRREADTFLTNDVSQDDPYLLYCALHSGKNTIIVSRDLMRGHRFLLKQHKLKIAFNRWLSQRLYQLKYVDRNGRVTFTMPQNFTESAQKVGDYWHIPCNGQENSFPVTNSRTKESNILWLCIKL